MRPGRKSAKMRPNAPICAHMRPMRPYAPWAHIIKSAKMRPPLFLGAYGRIWAHISTFAPWAHFIFRVLKCAQMRPYAGGASPYVPPVPGHGQFSDQISVKTYVGTGSFYCEMCPRKILKVLNYN